MRAVMPIVPAQILALRRRTGEDRFDEVWEGVLHMAPSPTRTHQDLEGALERWLYEHWARPTGGRVYHQINVARPGLGAGWREDFRIPDLVLLSPERQSIDRDAYFDGGPDCVVEIRSPQDETLEKLPFYAAIGCREIWVIDRDTKAPEVHRVSDHALSPVDADADGWVQSACTGVRLRAKDGLLQVQLGTDGTTRRALPEPR